MMRAAPSGADRHDKLAAEGNASDMGKFTVRRVVNWGDCDPAGIVYTPRVLDYACETIDARLRQELKASWWQGRTSGKGPGLPTVNVVCDFISILRPDKSVELTLYAREIGRSSVVFEVEGLAEGNRLAFRTKLTSCAVDVDTNRATPVSEWLRAGLEAYINGNSAQKRFAGKRTIVNSRLVRIAALRRGAAA